MTNPNTTTEGQFLFTKINPSHGSNVLKINVDRAGVPFGQIWTIFRDCPGEVHPWHAKPLTGEHKTFWENDGGLRAAMDYMKSS